MAKDIAVRSAKTFWQSAAAYLIATFSTQMSGVETRSEKLYRVQVGAYLLKENAEDMKRKINAVGFDAFIVKE